jgi:hypothetical protein
VGAIVSSPLVPSTPEGEQRTPLIQGNKSVTQTPQSHLPVKPKAVSAPNSVFVSPSESTSPYSISLSLRRFLKRKIMVESPEMIYSADDEDHSLFSFDDNSRVYNSLPPLKYSATVSPLLLWAKRLFPAMPFLLPVSLSPTAPPTVYPVLRAIYSPGEAFSGNSTTYGLPLLSQPFLKLQIPPPPLYILARHEPPPLVGELYPVIVCISGETDNKVKSHTLPGISGIDEVLKPKSVQSGLSEGDVDLNENAEEKRNEILGIRSPVNGKIENQIINDVAVNIKWVGEGALSIYWVSQKEKDLVISEMPQPLDVDLISPNKIKSQNLTDPEKDYIIYPVPKTDIRLGDISMSSFTTLPLILHSSYPVSGNLIITLSHSMVLTSVDTPFGEIGSPPVRYCLSPFYVPLSFVPSFIPTYRIFSPVPLLFSSPKSSNDSNDSSFSYLRKSPQSFALSESDKRPVLEDMSFASTESELKNEKDQIVQAPDTFTRSSFIDYFTSSSTLLSHSLKTSTLSPPHFTPSILPKYNLLTYFPPLSAEKNCTDEMDKLTFLPDVSIYSVFSNLSLLPYTFTFHSDAVLGFSQDLKTSSFSIQIPYSADIVSSLDTFVLITIPSLVQHTITISSVKCVFDEDDKRGSAGNPLQTTVTLVDFAVSDCNTSRVVPSLPVNLSRGEWLSCLVQVHSELLKEKAFLSDCYILKPLQGFLSIKYKRKKIAINSDSFLPDVNEEEKEDLEEGEIKTEKEEEKKDAGPELIKKVIEDQKEKKKPLKVIEENKIEMKKKEVFGGGGSVIKVDAELPLEGAVNLTDALLQRDLGTPLPESPPLDRSPSPSPEFLIESAPPLNQVEIQENLKVFEQPQEVVGLGPSSEPQVILKENHPTYEFLLPLLQSDVENYVSLPSMIIHKPLLSFKLEEEDKKPSNEVVEKSDNETKISSLLSVPFLDFIEKDGVIGGIGSSVTSSLLVASSPSQIASLKIPSPYPIFNPSIKLFQFEPFTYKLSLHNSSSRSPIHCILALVESPDPVDSKDSIYPHPFLISGTMAGTAIIPASTSFTFNFIITPVGVGPAILPRLFCLIAPPEHIQSSSFLRPAEPAKPQYLDEFYLSVNSLSLYEKASLLTSLTQSAGPISSTSVEDSKGLSQTKPQIVLSSLIPSSPFSMLPLPIPTNLVPETGEDDNEKIDQKVTEKNVGMNKPHDLLVNQLGSSEVSVNSETLPSSELTWVPQINVDQPLIISSSNYAFPYSNINLSHYPYFSQLLRNIPDGFSPLTLLSPLYNVYIFPKL